MEILQKILTPHACLSSDDARLCLTYVCLVSDRSVFLRLIPMTLDSAGQISSPDLLVFSRPKSLSPGDASATDFITTITQRNLFAHLESSISTGCVVVEHL